VIPERFDGKGFLVTGGTRGLGRAIVVAAAARGASVVFCGRPGSEPSAEKVLADLEQVGAKGKGSFVPADVSREGDVERLFGVAQERLSSLHVVVNCAGIVRDKLLVETSLAEWNEVLATNLRGPFLVSRLAVEEFLAGGERGCIINISSIAANGSTGQASYAASKSALLSLTRSIAKEYGPRGIRCNAVVPGWVESETTARFSSEQRHTRETLSPHRRFARPDEVAEAVLFLASEESSFVNGDALYVSGAVHDVPDLR
jgi:3-oxoacyl-[acyl-carrier protein] reductase